MRSGNTTMTCGATMKPFPFGSLGTSVACALLAAVLGLGSLSEKAQAQTPRPSVALPAAPTPKQQPAGLFKATLKQGSESPFAGKIIRTNAPGGSQLILLGDAGIPPIAITFLLPQKLEEGKLPLRSILDALADDGSVSEPAVSLSIGDSDEGSMFTEISDGELVVKTASPLSAEFSITFTGTKPAPDTVLKGSFAMSR
jgi:hypothetical protein